MIKVKNLTTGEVIVVHNIKCNRVTGIIQVEKQGQEPKERFYMKHSFLLKSNIVNGFRTFLLADGYELVKTGATGTQPQPQPATEQEQPTTETQPQEQETPEAEVEVVTEQEQETEQPQPRKKAKEVDAPKTDGLNDALTSAFAPIFAGVAKQIEANIRAEVSAEIDALKKAAKTHVQRIELTANGEKHEVEGVFCEEFEDLCEDVNLGYYPYLWGAAGCGKSYTAEQIAKALGLDFYAQTMLNFAHEISGYGDAGGNYVETAFFKAFTQGGLFFLDEADRSQCEGLVALNTALANKRFTFPVVGSIEAHPRFRFICAGNTRMSGADEEYVSGQVQDGSFKNRLTFYEMHYDRRVELPVMAQGDEELVDFVEDVRRAIKECRICHAVSYRETEYMKRHETKKECALIRQTFKGLEIDAVRMIYNELRNKENAWAKALAKVVK